MTRWVAVLVGALVGCDFSGSPVRSCVSVGKLGQVHDGSDESEHFQVVNASEALVGQQVENADWDSDNSDQAYIGPDLPKFNLAT